MNGVKKITVRGGASQIIRPDVCIYICIIFKMCIYIYIYLLYSVCVK